MHGRSPDSPLPSAAELAIRLAEPLGTDPPAISGTRSAAVLLLLFDLDEGVHTILTKRSDEMVHHPGQISLPGGGFEEEDRTLVATALRETREEIGVPEGQVEIVRRLAPVYTRVSGFLVTPFVGLARGPIDPRPCDREIARVMQIPIDDVLSADARLPRFPTLETLRYPLDGEDVWGATARILADFSQVLRRALSRPL